MYGEAMGSELQGVRVRNLYRKSVNYAKYGLKKTRRASTCQPSRSHKHDNSQGTISK